MSHWIDKLSWAHAAYINIALLNIPVFHNILEYSYTKNGQYCPIWIKPSAKPATTTTTKGISLFI